MPRKKKTSPAPPVTSREKRDDTTAWARKVVAGEIVAGELMRLAAERHIRDVESQAQTGLVWDADAAQEALRFFPELFSVTAGAKAGLPFELPSYLTFVVGSLFGWRTSSGRMRFRQAWLELGKGMVKTPLSAAIGLYFMGWRGIPRSEVYAIAKDKLQANVLFQDAVNLCRAQIPGMDNTSLESSETVIIRGTGEMSWLIEHPSTGSKFRSLANDERISGPRPSMVCADEIHEWTSTAQIELWQAALTKMPGDALLLLSTNTPAADQVVATELSEYYQSVLRGTFKDDAAFALIARVDPADDPMNDEACWPKALPLLGLTYPIENVRTAVQSSRHRLATSLATKRLYFGIPVGASEWWIDLDAWEGCQGVVDVEAMRGFPCYLALDLSQKNDLTALTAVWSGHPDGKARAKTWYWRPNYAVADAARADGAQYVEWAEGGHLNLVPGRAIEYEYVAAKIEQLCAEQHVVLLAFDPAHISEFRKACDRIAFATWIWRPDEMPGSGLKMMVHAQGRAGMHSKQALWMPRSLTQLEDAILKGELIVDRNPLTSWCSANAAVQADAQNNRWLVKKRQRGRIDGVVSLAMAMGAAELKEEPQRQPEFQMFVLQ